MSLEGVDVAFVSRVPKITPNGRDLMPVKNLCRTLNNIFYTKGNKKSEETIWYAFLPWRNNPDKKWYLLCSTLPEVYDPRAIALTNLCKKRYPELKLELAYFFSRDVYFDAREHIGTYV